MLDLSKGLHEIEIYRREKEIEQMRRVTPKPKIYTLCGSMRFERLFVAWNKAITLSGHLVFSVMGFPSQAPSPEVKDLKHLLDLAHRRKIAASDGIVVLNKDGYIGESTLGEIKWAYELEKPVHFLQSWGQGCGPHRQPITSVAGIGGHPMNRCVYSGDVLGPASELRSSLVEYLEAMDAK